jgi:putative redox protein
MLNFRAINDSADWTPDIIMDAKVNWQGRLTFTGTADSGFEIPLGASRRVGGDEDGLRPMELIALGLAGCTAIDVISILQKKRQQVTDFRVEVHSEQASEHPRVFTRMLVDYHVTGSGVEEVAVVRSIELSATKYCPVQGMLAPVVPIELRYHIYQAHEDREPELVVSGEYKG